MYTSMFRKAMLGGGDSPLLSLDFTAGTVPTAVTFTRADSTARATYIDASGYVKTVASAGDARFDYVGGVAKGLLIEAAATNIMCLSETFETSGGATSWNYSALNTTRGTVTTTNPAGVSGTVVKIEETTANGLHAPLQVPTISASTTYTFSVWAKAAERSFLQLYENNGSSANSMVNLSNGNVVSESTAGITTVTPVGTTGWYRIAMQFTSAVGQTGGNCQLRLSTNGTTTSYGGTTGSGLYVWGAQLELGSSASSYVSTTTATRTRLADDAVIRSTAWSSLYAQPGAMVVEFYRGAYGAGSRSVLATDTTAARHWDLLHANGSATSQIAFSSGSAVTQTGLVSGLNKVALAWNAPSPTASFDLCVNGATPTFGGSNVGTTLSTWLTLGSQSTTGVSGTGTWDNYLNNSIKSVKYYTGLTYAEMQAKTT